MHEGHAGTISSNAKDGACPLFEHLPIPCLYLSINHVIEEANAAARRLVHVALGTTLTGTSIFATKFETSFLQGSDVLKQVFDDIVESANLAANGSSFIEHNSLSGVISDRHQIEDKSDLLVRDLASCENSQFQWQVALVEISNQWRFSLTASPRLERALSRPDKDQEYDLLRKLVEPTFDEVNYYVNVQHASSSRSEINPAGHRGLPEFTTARSKNISLGTWDEAFTKPLGLEDGVGPTSLRNRQGKISYVRGLEHTVTGARTVHDATTTVLKNPCTDDLLGVLVQVRDAIPYEEHLQRIDVESRAAEAVAKIESLPALVKTFMMDGSVDYFCANWERLTGTSRRDLLQNWTKWYHPDDLPRIEQMISAGMANGRPIEFQARIQNGNAWHHFQERFAPLFIDGVIVRYYCISTDVHAMTADKLIAQESTQGVYNLINNINIILFEVDDTWKVTTAEGALRVKTSDGQIMTAADYPGTSLYDICSIIRPGGIQELMDELVKVMDGQEGRVVVDYRLGDADFRTIAIPGVDSSPDKRHKLYGITLDVTAERAAEVAELKVQSMQAADRTKSQFLANISHEIRTPISGLLGILELLGDTTLDGAQQDCVMTLRTLAQSLLVIVNDVLLLSKIEAGANLAIDKLPFSFTDVLGDVCRSNEFVATKKGVEFNYHTTNLPRLLIGDAGRVRQVLQNLISNAVKFTDQGAVTVQLKNEVVGNLSRIEVRINDTGVGIDSAALPNLFQPFVQADSSTTREYGGTGLGLSIARNLARLMGGDITLESKIGHGTTAVFTIELSTQSTSQDATGTPNTSTRSKISLADLPGLEDLHILVAEDNKVNQKVVMFHLRKVGIKNIDIVESGAEAIRYIKAAYDGGNSWPDTDDQTRRVAHMPDIILMDCQMPVMDGYDATRQLRDQFKYDRPIIALTASAIQGDRENCLAAGMDDHIAKPVSKDVLCHTLRKWLTRR